MRPGLIFLAGAMKKSPANPSRARGSWQGVKPGARDSPKSSCIGRHGPRVYIGRDGESTPGSSSPTVGAPPGGGGGSRFSAWVGVLSAARAVTLAGSGRPRGWIPAILGTHGHDLAPTVRRFGDGSTPRQVSPEREPIGGPIGGSHRACRAQRLE
jgi:hypothetical protein